MSVTCDRSVTPGTPVSSTNNVDCNDKTEISLKASLNTITPTFRKEYPLVVWSKSNTQDVLSHHHMTYVLDSKRPNYDFPLTTAVVSIIYSS